MTDVDPRVTVVIPAYNAEATLGPAIDSVLDQTFEDIRVIVIDDGSSDGTSEVAHSYGGPVSCVRTANRGVSEARNEGIRRADGELVALLDADDLWEREKLARQIRLLDARPEAGVCTTGTTRVDGELRPIRTFPAQDPPDPCATLLLHSMVLGPISSPLIRAEIARDCGGFDPSLSQCADWDYFIRLSRRTTFAVIEDPLVRYRVSGANMSSDIELLERDTFAVLDNFFAGEMPSRYAALESRCYSNHWMILSGSYLHAGYPAQAARCMTRSLRLHPANVARPLGVAGKWLRRAGAHYRGRAA